MKIPLHNLIESILKIENITSQAELEAVLKDKKKMQEVADKINALHAANVRRKSGHLRRD